jgi:mRNA-degrading endonuclease RelE of RelBE toxin-antitoxin system
MRNFKSTHTFERKLKKLIKKYPNIISDIKKVLALIEENPEVRDRIQGLEERIYKVRVPSSDMKKGKSGAYRMIYFLVDNNQGIILLTIYAKAKQENISEYEIREIMEKL